MKPLAPSLPYPLVCVLIGLAIGWTPMLVHGPIAEKWSYYYVDGGMIVWAYHAARLSIGLWVGLTAVPQTWFLRGPLCGALAMMPPALVAMANPQCGVP